MLSIRIGNYWMKSTRRWTVQRHIKNPSYLSNLTWNDKRDVYVNLLIKLSMEKKKNENCLTFFLVLYFFFFFRPLITRKFIFKIILHFFIFRFIYYFLNVKNLILSFYKSDTIVFIPFKDYYFCLKDDVINTIKNKIIFLLYIFKIHLWISIQDDNNIEKYFKLS